MGMSGMNSGGGSGKNYQPPMPNYGQAAQAQGRYGPLQSQQMNTGQGGWNMMSTGNINDPGQMTYTSPLQAQQQQRDLQAAYARMGAMGGGGPGMVDPNAGAGWGGPATANGAYTPGSAGYGGPGNSQQATATGTGGQNLTGPTQAGGGTDPTDPSGVVGSPATPGTSPATPGSSTSDPTARQPGQRSWQGWGTNQMRPWGQGGMTGPGGGSGPMPTNQGSPWGNGNTLGPAQLTQTGGPDQLNTGYQGGGNGGGKKGAQPPQMGAGGGPGPSGGGGGGGMGKGGPPPAPGAGAGGGPANAPVVPRTAQAQGANYWDPNNESGYKKDFAADTSNAGVAAGLNSGPWAGMNDQQLTGAYSALGNSPLRAQLEPMLLAKYGSQDNLNRAINQNWAGGGVANQMTDKTGQNSYDYWQKMGAKSYYDANPNAAGPRPAWLNTFQQG